MDGIICVNKPLGITSFDVIRKLRRITGIKKIGHAGTLDPEAKGVLPILIGFGTGCSDFLINEDKVYRAEMTLGAKTDTQDHTGNIIVQSVVKVTKEQIVDTINNNFLGEIEQVPPIYSAIKINGKPLYKYARENKEPVNEIKGRRINIYSIKHFEFTEENGSVKKVSFTVHCSKGTYIRTLCNDIGEALGCYAYMSSLTRVKSGIFTLDSSFTLEEIEELFNSNEIDKFLIPSDYIFTDYKAIKLNRSNIIRYLNGVPVKIYKLKKYNNHEYEVDELIRLYNEQDIFIGLARISTDDEGFILKPYKLFIRREELQ